MTEAPIRQTYEGAPQIGIYLLKIVYSYMFKLATFRALSIWCNTSTKTFFHCSKQFLNLSIFMLFSAPAFFVCLFHFFHICITFPFEGFFRPGKQTNKNVTWGEIRWIRRVGHGGHGVLVENCWTLSVVWTGAFGNHSSWNGQTSWKGLQKNSLNQDAASHDSSSWYTDADKFLEHSCTTRGSPSKR